MSYAASRALGHSLSATGRGQVSLMELPRVGGHPRLLAPSRGAARGAKGHPRLLIPCSASNSWKRLLACMASLFWGLTMEVWLRLSTSTYWIGWQLLEGALWMNDPCLSEPPGFC
uniref:Uncharacterized protein n=1 Tax=Arundo donax TaxID=35708 RepID=A0A0A9CYA6_ARUDO